MIVSMLDYYYNVLYQDQFQELFGHLDIGKNPTSERNSFLVFRISFSSLSTENVSAFRQSLNDRLNGAVRDFKKTYEAMFGTSIHKIKVNERNGISSFGSLADFISNSKFRNKVNSTINFSCISSLMNMIIRLIRH